jgi:hypothetical protein
MTAARVYGGGKVLQVLDAQVHDDDVLQPPHPQDMHIAAAQCKPALTATGKPTLADP